MRLIVIMALVIITTTLYKECINLNNILIIEDEEKISEILKAYLEKEGYSVYTTTKGLDAIKLFEKFEFNLVILDLMLPDISGEEVL